MMIVNTMYHYTDPPFFEIVRLFNEHLIKTHLKMMLWYYNKLTNLAIDIGLLILS